MMKKQLHSLLLFCFIFCYSGCQFHSQQVLKRVYSYPQIGVGYSVCFENDYAYITNNDGVVIFDVRQPDQPVEVNRIPSGVTFGIDVANNIASLASERGVLILDVKNPANPVLLKEIPMKIELHRVVIEDSKVYIASQEGLEILDISDLATITRSSHYHSGMAWGVAIRNTTVYLANYHNGVEIIDVTDVTQPKKTATLPNTKGAWDIYLHNESLYVARHQFGISIFNISDKESPQFLGSFQDDDGGESLGVWGNDNYVFVADNYNIELLNVSDLTQPYELGTYSKVKGAHDLCVNGNYIYVAAANKGLLILQLLENKSQ